MFISVSPQLNGQNIFKIATYNINQACLYGHMRHPACSLHFPRQRISSSCSGSEDIRCEDEGCEDTRCQGSEDTQCENSDYTRWEGSEDKRYEAGSEDKHYEGSDTCQHRKRLETFH